MKTNKNKFAGTMVRVSSFLLLSLLFVQCIGPEGPKGDDGLDGLDGINNVHAVIYDVNPASWEGDVNGYYAYLDVPEITEGIYYNGAVLVYRIFETAPKTFNSVPYTYVDNTLIISMDFDAYVGGIDLIYKEVFDGVNDTPAPTELMSFKVVIIEGLPLAKVKSLVDVNDLSAVTKLFNINSVDKAVQ